MAKRKANKALLKKLPISAELASVIGKGPISRGQMMKKIWVYIKKQGIQDGREIHLDPTLKELFNTRKKVITMFELAKLLSPHIGEEHAGRKTKKNPSYDYEDEEEEDEDDYDDEDEDEDYDDEE